MEQHPTGPESAVSPELEKPTPEQEEQALGFIRQWRLFVQRGDKPSARKALEEAVAIAPGSLDVIEAQVQDLLARSQSSKAKSLLKDGLLLYPGNAKLETRLAELLFNLDVVENAGENLSDFEKASQGRIAAWASVFVPGLGQMITGRIPLGIGVLAVFVICWILITSIPDGLRGLFSLVGLGGASPTTFNGAVVLPLFIATATHLFSIADASHHAKKLSRVKIEHPLPPVDKDF